MAKKKKDVKAVKVKALVVLEVYTVAEVHYIREIEKAVTALHGMKAEDRIKLRVKIGVNADRQGISIKAELTRAFGWDDKTLALRYNCFMSQISQAKNDLSATTLKKMGMEKKKTVSKFQGYTEKSLEAVGKKLERSKPEIVLSALQNDMSVLVDKAAKLEKTDIERIEYLIHSLVSIAKLHGIFFKVEKVITRKATATVNHKAVTVN